MNKLALTAKLKELYDRGENILEFLKKQTDGLNDAESIMISYDLQAGSYTKFAETNAGYLNQYTNAIARAFSGLPPFATILEVGVGEATLMNPLMSKIAPTKEIQKFGFDISWSRTRYARQNAERAGHAINLFMANLFEIPLPDNAIDVVYTSHSLEPNGGREKAALQELYRVANKHVVLLEPDYDNAPEQGKDRMTRHGYVRDLAKHAEELGYEVVEHRPLGVSVNPLNPTGLTVLKKREPVSGVTPSFACPVTRSLLSRRGNAYFTAEGGLIYPIIDGIPCLLGSAAILGWHFESFSEST